MTPVDRERFNSLCNEYGGGVYDGSIGTYNEKRLHLILKHLVSPDASKHETRLGRCVADVFDDGHIYEIQTGSLNPLSKKLDFYLNNTDHKITVIKPFILSKRIVRVDRETGEVIRAKKSPKKATDGDLYSELYWIADYLSSDRIELIALYINADEYRYSDEKVRYRKSGKYDSELFPRELVDVRYFNSKSSFEYLLEGCNDSFFAKEFSAIHKIKGRALYRTLNMLCKLSLLEREKTQSGAYEYKKITPETEIR